MSKKIVNKSKVSKRVIDFDKLVALAIRFIEKYSEKELFEGGLYPTQKEICRSMIINSFSRSGRRINISITRQYGKSTIVFKVAIFIAIFAPSIL